MPVWGNQALVVPALGNLLQLVPGERNYKLQLVLQQVGFHLEGYHQESALLASYQQEMNRLPCFRRG